MHRANRATALYCNTIVVATSGPSPPNLRPNLRPYLRPTPANSASQFRSVIPPVLNSITSSHSLSDHTCLPEEIHLPLSLSPKLMLLQKLRNATPPSSRIFPKNPRKPADLRLRMTKE